MTQSIDTAAAIDLVRQQLESYLPDDLEAWEWSQERQPLEKARQSGIVEPDGMGQWLRRSDTGETAFVRGRLLDLEKAEALIEAAAAGDKEADAQVSAIAIWLLEKGCSLPDTFREFVIKLLRNRLPKPRANRNLARDIQYCVAIHRLQEYGFSPTRNRGLHGKANATESGCSILSKTLAAIGQHVSERMLEQIWEKYSNRR
ncbi:hypothetical protein [Sinorhizobium sp. M4_45]|uniref:hypothetical protein n=1 Tax=Sinorhizobium sp. M4_45 TaxID=2037901 RepID=UPI000C9A6C0E|nr:hypothetical protein [Sinorhizobium sp. M4_45]PND26791.1 hypothetical protein CN933_13675 [Sinorhizobium sp. M4_45]